MTHLQTSQTNGVLHIEFNRPEKKNALTLDMYEQAAIAFEQANSDSTVRAVIISGRGGSFTAGNDLMDFLNASDNGSNGLNRFLSAVPACEKPIIAAVQGYAVGIGTTMLLHCDLIYADDSAKFQMPFVNLGLCPEFGSSLLLPQLIGQRRAAEMLYLGKTINADTAADYGLINAKVDDALAAAKTVAEQLALLPAASIRVSKALMNNGNQQQLIERIEQEAVYFAERMQGPEAKEAMTAFIEKRAPDFSQFD
ncbi:MAG: enoyl-CoA hydratase/carnithine racemase [Oceanicoccus sp.]|jgi:enoyl-CoA hydratase/carnithine racemase